MQHAEAATQGLGVSTWSLQTFLKHVFIGSISEFPLKFKNTFVDIVGVRWDRELWGH